MNLMHINIDLRINLSIVTMSQINEIGKDVSGDAVPQF